jgi:hypothetical protein
MTMSKQQTIDALMQMAYRAHKLSALRAKILDLLSKVSLEMLTYQQAANQLDEILKKS